MIAQMLYRYCCRTAILLWQVSRCTTPVTLSACCGGSCKVKVVTCTGYKSDEQVVLRDSSSEVQGVMLQNILRILIQVVTECCFLGYTLDRSKWFKDAFFFAI